LSRSEEDFFFFCLSEKGKEHYHGEIKAATLLCHMFPALIKLNKKKRGTPNFYSFVRGLQRLISFDRTTTAWKADLEMAA
jgi:hypothetical protein